MSVPLFDAHCDTISRCARLTSAHFSGTGGQWDLDRMGECSPAAQFFAIFWDSARHPGESAQLFQDQYQVFRRELDRLGDRAAFCRSAGEAEAAFRQGKLAAFLSVEGGELLDCSLERLEEAHRLGVRAVNLTWNHANALSGSHCDQPERGLSPLGKNFVDRMEELGMLIDLSHLSDPGIWDVLERSAGPVLASHSNSRAVCSHTRNLTDGQMAVIIEKHGVIGLNLYDAFLTRGKATEDSAVAQIEHIWALGGRKSLALGGDWDGGITGPAGYEGVWDWARLYERLLRDNVPEGLIQDLFFNNMMRIVSEVCTM